MTPDLCRLLDIDIPILSAPMGGAAGPDLVAAVCEAGGYGTIPLWGRAVAAVEAGIDAVRARTGGNFAVNIRLDLPHDEAIGACIDRQVHAVSLFWGHSPATIEAARRGGLTVMVSVGSAEEARIAAEAGADVIVAQGWEAGGHVWGQVATLALVPAVADAVNVPVVAAGGIADGRGMAAALTLGASGVWIGTRFLASREATIHPDYRARILAAPETASEWYGDLYDGNWPDAPHRALANATARAWREAGAAAPGQRPGEGEAIGLDPGGAAVRRYQSYTPHPETSGDIAAMSLWAGQGVGLVRDVQPAAEIVREIHEEARRILNAAPGLLE